MAIELKFTGDTPYDLAAEMLAFARAFNDPQPVPARYAPDLVDAMQAEPEAQTSDELERKRETAVKMRQHKRKGSAEAVKAEAAKMTNAEIAAEILPKEDPAEVAAMVDHHVSVQEQRAYTHDDARIVLNKLLRAYGTGEEKENQATATAFALLKAFGAGKVSEIAEADLPAFVSQCAEKVADAALGASS